MPDYCSEHPNTELIAAEDTGTPTCWVCVALRVVELPRDHRRRRSGRHHRDHRAACGT